MEKYEINGYIALLAAIIKKDDTVTIFKNLGIDIKEKKTSFWTQDQLDWLRELVIAGYKNKEIAEKMGYTYQQIHNQKAYLRRNGRLEKVEELKMMKN